MQTEWIRAFVLLKEKMNFTEAAEEMYVSPSSFSKYIKALETDLGVTLVDRSRHRFCLTREGEAVYPYAQKALEACDAMMQAAQRGRFEASRELRVCVSAASNTAVYIRQILSFFEEHPQLLSLHEYDAKNARKAFLEGSLDMVISYTGLFPELTGAVHPDGCAMLILRQEELFYAGLRQAEAGADRPEQMQSIPLEKVLTSRLILHQNTWSELRSLPSFSENDLQNTCPVVTTTSTDVLKAYLLSGTAHSLLSPAAARTLNLEHRLILTPVDEHPTLSLGLAYRTDTLPEAGEKLLAHLKNIAGLPFPAVKTLL